VNRLVADVQLFTHGWINPVLAYLMAFLGSLLGLVLAERARAVRGLSRVRWLVLAALAVGGTGVWLMHFLAMLGFDIPSAIIRYDPWYTLASFGVVVAASTIGLLLVGYGQPSGFRILVAGPIAGAGFAAMHHLGMSAIHFGGRLVVDRNLSYLSLGIAAIAGTLLAWFVVVIRGPGATVAAAALLAIAMCSMHYTGMAALSAQTDGVDGPVDGLSPFVLLGPISVLACVLISALAYTMAGFSIRRENAREDAMFAKARQLHEAGAILHLGGARHR
jgi:NO-binding membrane sensor protein with MHYT domain